MRGTGMHKNTREGIVRMRATWKTQERYCFLKGIVIECWPSGLSLVPFGTRIPTKVTFDDDTRFWKGGLSETPKWRDVAAVAGDIGTVAAFRNDEGTVIADVAYFNHHQIRGTIFAIHGHLVVVEVDTRYDQTSFMAITWDAQTLDHDNNHVTQTDFNLQTSLIAWGELTAPYRLHAYRVEMSKGTHHE